MEELNQNFYTVNGTGLGTLFYKFTHTLSQSMKWIILFAEITFVKFADYYICVSVIKLIFKFLLLQRCQPLRNILTSILKWKYLCSWIAEFFENSAIRQDKYIQFKILVNVFRRCGQLWIKEAGGNPPPLPEYDKFLYVFTTYKYFTITMNLLVSYKYFLQCFLTDGWAVFTVSKHFNLLL